MIQKGLLKKYVVTKRLVITVIEFFNLLFTVKVKHDDINTMLKSGNLVNRSLSFSLIEIQLLQTMVPIILKDPAVITISALTLPLLLKI